MADERRTPGPGALSDEGADPMVRAALAHRGKGQAPMRRSRQQDRGPRSEYLAFTLGGDVYAAPVSRIREILKPPPLTHLPRAPREILGIVSVRGQLVTVMDLRRRLRLAEPEPTRRARILLADAAHGEILGLLVDEVLQVYRLAEHEIEPTASALGAEVAGYISGIARPRTASGRTVEGASPSTTRRTGEIAGSTDPYGPSVIVLLDLRAVLGA